MQKSLDDSIKILPGIGNKRAELFSSIGIRTVKDLLFYFPHKHLDRTRIIDSSKLAFYLSTGFDGEVTLIGKVESKELVRYGNKKIFKVTLKDEKGYFDLVWFNGIDYLQNKYNEKEIYAISGKPTLTRYNHIQFAHPDFDKIDTNESKDFLHTGKIIPFYKIPDVLRKNYIGEFSLRKLMSNVVFNYSDLIKEFYSESFLQENNLIDLNSCIKNIHFPVDNLTLNKSLFRIKFDELFFLELILAERKYSLKRKITGNMFVIKAEIIKKFLNSLPFELTKAQLKVLSEIRKDFESGKPMNRLLQGDVGSGKTVVAAICALISSSNNFQSVIVAPTEILAIQHYKLIYQYLSQFNSNIFLLTGGNTSKEKNMIVEKINKSNNSIIIGTHALFEENILFNNLGLVIIDEQHKFGVVQRASLIQKGKLPHVLVMSATPIPRTLSMTLYGDLDISIIDEIPKNRKPVKTFLRTEKDLEKIYKFIKDRIAKGEQAFIVYPVIEESKDANLKSAQIYYEQLSRNVFNDFKIELLHGRLNNASKENIMRDFKQKKIDILVSTTVIEVGIDIEDATIMLINNPERFGLSQLHQLRGRVGRGEKQSYCILIVDSKIKNITSDDNLFSEFASKQQIEKDKTFFRLNSFANTLNGFELAEIDLKIRGPGDILGTKQSGLPELRYAKLPDDLDILIKARDCAFNLIDSDPELSLPENTFIREKYYLLISSLNISNVIS